MEKKKREKKKTSKPQDRNQDEMAPPPDTEQIPDLHPNKAEKEERTKDQKGERDGRRSGEKEKKPNRRERIMEKKRKRRPAIEREDDQGGNRSEMAPASRLHAGSLGRGLLSAVFSILLVVRLLALLSLAGVWNALSVGHLAPSLAEDLADFTERQVGVVLLELATLLIREEEVGGKGTLGGVGVCNSEKRIRI